MELEENEVKLLLVAIRQVRNTFAIAEAQSKAAGQPLGEEYAPVQEAYDLLHAKLNALIEPQGPQLVK